MVKRIEAAGLSVILTLPFGRGSIRTGRPMPSAICSTTAADRSAVP
ncbi:MAG: hypothetical protein GDA49_02500 [Rhodospirillales bacterium]|nr:hypothetical protein [Rhodospirillales bacterium]